MMGLPLLVREPATAQKLDALLDGGGGRTRSTSNRGSDAELPRNPGLGGILACDFRICDFRICDFRIGAATVTGPSDG